MKSYAQGGFSDEFYSALDYYLSQHEGNGDEDVQEPDEDVDDTDEVIDTQEDTADFPEEELNPDAMGGIDIAINHSASQVYTGEEVPVNQNLSWLPVKDKSVNIGSTNSQLVKYLNQLPTEVRQRLLATSGSDSPSVHAENSKHGEGKAIDLRYDKGAYDYIANDPNLQAMGLTVLPPNHGTAPHIHIQTKQFGGKYKL